MRWANEISSADFYKCSSVFFNLQEKCYSMKLTLEGMRVVFFPLQARSLQVGKQRLHFEMRHTLQKTR